MGTRANACAQHGEHRCVGDVSILAPHSRVHSAHSSATLPGAKYGYSGRRKLVRMPMHKLPLGAVAAEDFGDPQLHVNTRFMAIHSYVRSLDAHPVSQLVVGGGVQDLECVGAAGLEQP